MRPAVIIVGPGNYTFSYGTSQVYVGVIAVIADIPDGCGTLSRAWFWYYTRIARYAVVFPRSYPNEAPLALRGTSLRDGTLRTYAYDNHEAWHHGHTGKVDYPGPGWYRQIAPIYAVMLTTDNN